MNPCEIRLHTTSGPLAAQRWNTGPVPVLALHGWLDNSATFDRLAPFLQGLDLVALDFSGHGLSAHRPGQDSYHFIDWVPEVFEVADALGWSQFGLLGHSMGAGVAVLSAGTFPERINNMVLIDGLGPFTSPEEEAPQRLAKAILHRPSPAPKIYPTNEEAERRLIARGLLPESAHCLASRALTKVEGGWVFHYAQKVRTPSRARLSEPQVRAFLKAITCPTLLIRATDGLDMPACFVGREHDIADFTTLHRQGGHHLHLDFPERVWEDILNHFQSDDPIR